MFDLLPLDAIDLQLQATAAIGNVDEPADRRHRQQRRPLNTTQPRKATVSPSTLRGSAPSSTVVVSPAPTTLAAAVEDLEDFNGRGGLKLIGN